MTPDPALKGKKDGNCNRQACQAPGATYFNVGTDAYYCPACACRINRAMTATDKETCQQAYGVSALCLPPHAAYHGLDDIQLRKAAQMTSDAPVFVYILSTVAGQRATTGFLYHADDAKQVLALVSPDGRVWKPVKSDA